MAECNHQRAQPAAFLLLLVAVAYGASSAHAINDLCQILTTKSCQNWQHRIAAPASYLDGDYGYDGMASRFGQGNKEYIILTNSLRKCQDYYESTFECKDSHITEIEVLCTGNHQCGKTPNTCAVPVKKGGEQIPYVLGTNQYGDVTIKHPDGTTVFTCTGSRDEIAAVNNATAALAGNTTDSAPAGNSTTSTTNPTASSTNSTTTNSTTTTPAKGAAVTTNSPSPSPAPSPTPSPVPSPLPSPIPSPLPSPIPSPSADMYNTASGQSTDAALITNGAAPSQDNKLNPGATQSDSSGKSSRVSGGAIAAIVIVSTLALAAIAAVIVYVVKKRPQTRAARLQFVRSWSLGAYQDMPEDQQHLQLPVVENSGPAK